MKIEDLNIDINKVVETQVRDAINDYLDNVIDVHDMVSKRLESSISNKIDSLIDEKSVSLVQSLMEFLE